MWIRCDSDVATGGSDAVPWLDGYYDEDDNDHHYDQNLSIMINFGWDKDETEQIMILHNYMALEIRNFKLFNKISDTKN